MEDKRLTKHGFPKGFRFVPKPLELITILSYKIHDRRLHSKLRSIFHDLNILDYHPQQLHDMYESDKEHRFIYFFSWRQFQRQATRAAAGGGPPVHRKRQRGAVAQDEDDNEPRPVRLAKDGGWKHSGGGHVLHWPKDKGGYVAGKMVTKVFYDHDNGQQVKSQWGMHEFIVPVDSRLLSKTTTKTTRFYDLALYRLYKIKSDDTETDVGAGSNNQMLANVGAGSSNQTLANVVDGRHFSASCPAGQPSFGIFTGRNQTLAAGPSTSRMRPPPTPQQLLHHIPNSNVGHPQYYHHQYAFGAATASAAHQPVRTMTMPPACGTGMLHGHQALQFARPPAPSQMPVPPAAGNPASHQLMAAYYAGAGQEASDSGGTRSLPLAPVSTPPPAAAESPSSGEELAPILTAAATHGVAGGQEAGDDFGATRCSLAAERDAATASTAEPAGQHVQPADCVKPEEEETVPYSPIPADFFFDEVGMQDWNFDLAVCDGDDEKFWCTMDELCPMSDEPPLTQEEPMSD